MTFFKISQSTVLKFCLLLVSAFFLTAIAKPVPLDKVVAVVNSSVLTQNQLNETIQAVKQQLESSNQPLPDAATLRKKALDQAIGELLQLQVAQRANIVVSDADVTRAITQIAEQNHLTLEQLKTELQKQRIQYKPYRAQIHNQLVMHQIQQQALGTKINVSASEVQAYLKKATIPKNDQTQYRLSDLLIPLSDTATADEIKTATQQAKKLLAKARTTTNLNELAQGNIEYIDLQWRTIKDLPAVLANAVNGLKVGEVAGPVKAPNGLHVLRLLEIKGQTKPLTAEQAKQILWQQKMQEESDRWSKELRKNSYIKIM